MTPAATALAADHLVRRFGDRTVINDVSLTIAAGESVALVGPSGHGKTTLLHMLGLLDRPDGGRVMIDGRDGWAASEAARGRLRLTTLGFVFQQHNLIEHLSARDNVAIAAWRAHGSRRRALDDAERWLDRFGLAGRAAAPAHQLSLGEAQRVAIARAVINQPRIILADEPTGSLDPEAARVVLDVLFASEPAVLVVTHDREVAARAQRTVVLRDGKLVTQLASASSPTSGIVGA